MIKQVRITLMKAFYLLLASLAAIHSAIIGNNVFALTRLLEYQINITNHPTNIMEYATLAPTQQNCSMGKCFYGWIRNYTVGNRSFEGFNLSLAQDNPLFHLTLSKSSFSIVSSGSLPPPISMLL